MQWLLIASQLDSLKFKLRHYRIRIILSVADRLGYESAAEVLNESSDVPRDRTCGR
jgi:hypothetical protein